MSDKIKIPNIRNKFLLVIGIYSLIICPIHCLHLSFFSIKILPYILMIIIGASMFLIGIVFLCISMVYIKFYKKDQLVITGVYAFSRYPIYSAIILFVLPGMTLLFNSWLLLTIPAFAYASFRFLIREEEYAFEHNFGEKYEEYKKKVNLLTPKLLK